MTPQEVFDKVTNHLRTQGRRSDDGEGCMYRGPGGTSCAVGCLIKDDEYVPSMERTNIQYLISRPTLPASLKDRLLPHVELLADLQKLHDNYEVKDWERRLESVAGAYNLKYTPKVETQ